MCSDEMRIETCKKAVILIFSIQYLLKTYLTDIHAAENRDSAK